MCERGPLSLGNIQTPDEKDPLHPKSCNGEAAGKLTTRVPERPSPEEHVSVGSECAEGRRNVGKSSVCFSLKNKAVLVSFYLSFGF